MKECQFQDEFLADIRSHRAYAMGVVGSLFSAGQPDLDITSIHGNVTKAELKVYRNINVPTREQIIALLKGPQINVITKQLWPRNSNCVIIALIDAKPDTCCIVSKHKLSFDLWKNVSKIIAHLPYGSYTPWQ